MSKKPRLEINKEEFVEMYNRHYTYKKIAEHFSISEPSVHNLKEKYGLPRRNKPIAVDIHQFKRFYIEGAKINDIAKKLKISRSRVFHIRDKLRLPRRNRSKKTEGGLTCLTQ